MLALDNNTDIECVSDTSSSGNVDINKTTSTSSSSYRVLRIDPLIGLKINFGDTDKTWMKNLERILYRTITSVHLVPIVLLFQYLILGLYGYYALEWEANVILLIACVIGSTASRKYISYSISDQQTDIETTMASERKRILISLLAFTVRFIFVGKVKIIILPIYLCIIMSTNNLSKEYKIYSLIPIYYSCILHLGGAILELARYGFTLDSITYFCENSGIVLSILILSFHVMTTSENLKQKVRTLEKTREKLEEALSTKQTFLRHISHEFRSPCLSSLGSVELLRETNLTCEQRELVETIASSDGILLNLIEDILTVARFEHEKKENFKNTIVNVFNLGKCIQLIGAIINSYSKHFNVKLEILMDSITQNLNVRTSQTRIHQILSNLLTNAIKASKNGQTVNLICKANGEPQTNHGILQQEIEFKVIDLGSGIPKNKQREIFAPFSQLHNVNENIYPGSGLGLNIVSSHVNSMGGTISLKSEIDKGSEFTITLPLEIVVGDCVTELQEDADTSLKRQMVFHENYFRLFTEPTLQENTQPTKRTEIIIADDNPINRKVIVKLIESLGYETESVCNGKELVDAVDPKQHKLVITDLTEHASNGWY
ncbi:predicted protein [Naegleria gruberi]|uniref:histidine kinase n=1 Tax=Naegleria gruberi TaxID=5762 RepID=D2VA62_NAEGR|nr:uncharacterized protein NAEGRDRAFT_65750 [Naegleria gruberi]EFC46373.1 predicted protein [Naegleria gruberi]|eukprot:XP_002679117.1 predicted protein [Naegleria gruberi strain NEG-M]